jgi:hypothetical protein
MVESVVVCCYGVPGYLLSPSEARLSVQTTHSVLSGELCGSCTTLLHYALSRLLILVI